MVDHGDRRGGWLGARWAPPRAVLVDAALAGMVLLVGVVAITANLGVQRRPDGFAYLFVAGLAALMFLRRRFPVLILLASAVGIIAYHAAGFPPIGLALPVAAALFSAAEAGRLVWAAGTAALLVVFAAVVRLAVGDDPGLVLGYELALNVAVMAAAVAIGDGVRARRGWRAEQRQRALDAKLEREREAARRVQEERLRIARELHDVLAHSVAVISLHTDVADEAIADDPAAAHAALGRIRTASRDTMRELRTTIGLLRVADRPEPDMPAGLDQIDQIVSAATAGGLPVEVEVQGERPAGVPAVVDATGYRIVQEALTNTLRHAHANGARVCVRYAADRVEIRVTDDGCGSGGTPPAGGHGLTGMCERAALLGGHVRAGERPEGGFAVEASLPLVPS